MLREFLFRGYLEDKEKIEFVMHRHPILIAGAVMKIVLVGLALPAFVWRLFPQILPVALFWAWLGLMRLVYEFVDWYFDVWLVTNMSIMQIEWSGFFRKTSSRIEYHHVESIKYDVNGFWQTVLNYGMIMMEKITGNVEKFRGVYRPKKVTERLLKYQDNFVMQKNVRDHQTLKTLMSDMLQRHYLDFGMTEEKKTGGSGKGGK